MDQQAAKQARAIRLGQKILAWRALLPGSTSAITKSSAKPSFWATEFAVVLLSPVTIHVSMPMALRWRSTTALSGLGASAMPNKAATCG